MYPFCIHFIFGFPNNGNCIKIICKRVCAGGPSRLFASVFSRKGSYSTREISRPCDSTSLASETNVRLSSYNLTPVKMPENSIITPAIDIAVILRTFTLNSFQMKRRQILLLNHHKIKQIAI